MKSCKSHCSNSNICSLSTSLLFMIIIIIPSAITISTEETQVHHRCHHGERFGHLRAPLKLTSDHRSQSPASHNSYKRRILSTSTHSLKIQIDKSELDARVVTEFEKYNDVYQMMKRVINMVVRYLSKLITVNNDDTFSYRHLNPDDNNRCDISETDPSLHSFKNIDNTAINADLLVILIGVERPETEYVAAATKCAILNKNTGFPRSPIAAFPQLGKFEMNFALIKNNEKSLIYYFPISAHEFVHILGFDYDVFTDKSMLGNIIIGGIQYESLESTNLINFAKTYFNNQSITGIPLENDGTEGTRGSHFEKTFFMNELMNPTTENNLVISNFTAKVLEDLGYSINYDFIQYWNVGEALPHFFDQACPHIPEVCTDNNTPDCSYDGSFKGFCTEISTFSKGCPFYRASPTECRVSAGLTEIEKASPYKFQTFGAFSRCLLNSVQTEGGIVNVPICVQAKCTAAGIEYRTGDDSVSICAFKGQKIQLADYEGDFICPDPIVFCAHYSKRCPNDCSANGVCLASGKCFCYSEDDTLENTTPDCCSNGECAKEKEDKFRKYAQVGSLEYGAYQRGQISEGRTYNGIFILVCFMCLFFLCH